MKTLRNLVVITVVMVSVSCSKDEQPTPQPETLSASAIQENKLAGVGLATGQVTTRRTRLAYQPPQLYALEGYPFDVSAAAIGENGCWEDLRVIMTNPEPREINIKGWASVHDRANCSNLEHRKRQSLKFTPPTPGNYYVNYYAKKGAAPDRYKVIVNKKNN